MRGTVLRFGWLSAAVLGLGCYTSSGEEGDARDAAADEATADETTPADDGGTDVPPEADVVPDVGPDGAVECPPLMDGIWMSFSIDDDAFEAVDIDIPCRMEVTSGTEPDHALVRLECGTGGLMEVHTIEFLANPRVYLDFWSGEEVTFRYLADPVWWIDRWFTVRDRWGNLLFGGVNASRLAPWGSEPSDWFAPLGVRAVGGLCPAETSMCGPQERQAVEVTYGDSVGLIFDGYHGFVGDMVTADVHVSSATHYLRMDCDDVPDDWYNAIFVLLPEG